MRKNFKITLVLVMVLILSMVTVSFAAEAAKTEAAKPAAAKAADTKAPAVKKKLPKKIRVGDSIDEFKLPDGVSKGNVAFSSDIKGKSKVIAISFMTTACSACKAELSLLSDLANKYGDDFKAYAVSVDINGAQSVPAYDKRFGFNVRYLLDPDFALPQRFGFTYTPSLVLATGAGKVVYLKGGYSSSIDPDAVIQAVRDALK